MFDYKIILVTGYILSDIRNGIQQIDEIYLGLLLNSLRYDTDTEGKDKKTEYYNKIAQAIRKINNEITKFNKLNHYENPELTKVIKINLKKIKKIIFLHKGDFPKDRSKWGFINEAIGKGDSAPVISTRHTALLLRNALTDTVISLRDFNHSIDIYMSPFDCLKKQQIRKKTEYEVNKIKAVYSIYAHRECIFMLGRLLEHNLTEYLILLKKRKKIALTYKYIKSSNFRFENKIDFLRSKSFNTISDSMWAKMKSIKWDRNAYGHKVGSNPKDTKAMIIIGLLTISHIEQKISLLK